MLAIVNHDRYCGPVPALDHATTPPVSRRDQILATAAELFAERGFHGVSVGELGAACGMSGPGLYKHFPSKDAILAAMLVGISEELLSVGRGRVSAAATPAEALDELVDWHITFALDNKALIVVQDRDWSSLPAEAREKVRTLQRKYVDLWAAQLRKLDDALTPTEARVRAHAAFGLLNSTPHSAFLPAGRMREVLHEMALRALGAA
jgi:AcrR family transcriptional regulator